MAAARQGRRKDASWIAERLKLKLYKGCKVTKTKDAPRSEHGTHFSTSASRTNQSGPSSHDESSNQLSTLRIETNINDERSKITYDKVIEQHYAAQQCQQK